jgi:peptidoglycan/LPS O-acetylase OafA/YrhL
MIITAKPSPHPWALLGGVRFVLALIVATQHFGWFVRPAGMHADVGALAAVVGFLIVSGYSIAASYAHEPSGFYWRRFIRIYPLYLAALLLTALVVPSSAPGRTFPAPSPADWAANTFMLQGFTALPIDANPVVWSLSLEVFCYVLAPWLLRAETWVLWLIVGVSAAGSALAPLWGVYYTGMRDGLAWALLLWAWLLGVLIWRSPRAGRVAAVLAAALMLSHVLLWHTPPFSPLIAAAVALLVARPPRVPPWCAWLGDVSYPFYLFHVPAALLTMEWGLWASILTALCAGVIGAVLDVRVRRMVRTISFPSTNHKRRAL